LISKKELDVQFALGSLSDRDKLKIIFDTLTSVNMLTILLGDDKRSISDDVKLNLSYYDLPINNTSKKVLDILSTNDDGCYGRDNLPSNPAYLRKFHISKNVINLLPETIDRLSKNPSHEIRYNIARNSITPADVLIKLSEDDHFRVKSGVARNNNTPPHILKVLCKNTRTCVRNGVARNLMTSIEILKELANDPKKSVRNSVALHRSMQPQQSINFDKFL